MLISKKVLLTICFSCLWPFSYTPHSLPSYECAAAKLELGRGNSEQNLPPEQVGIGQLLGRYSVAEFGINESLSAS